MQMTGATAHQLPANRSPPTPMVQTPVGSPSSPPVFPTVEPVPGTERNAGSGSEEATPPAAEAAGSEAPGAGAATASASASAPTQNHVDHGRSVSQSSAASSSVPELVAAANSAINNN